MSGHAWLDRSLLSVEKIHQRLKRIIPKELDDRGFARREMAAKVVFVMLYGYAVEGLDAWIRPTAVTDMTDEQAARQVPEERKVWLERVQGPQRPRNVTGRWYGENTREPIRDETIKALIDFGAVIERQGVPTTSPKPRYSLSMSFTELFSPVLEGGALEQAITHWREAHLSKAALARIVLARKGVSGEKGGVLVRLPNGEARRLAPGPSALLTKVVVESFAPRFLRNAAVVLISESAQKLTYRDEQLSRAIGFTIRTEATLPDVMLVDTGADPPVVVFVECVISDGPVNERRRRELETLATDGGFTTSDCAYVTAFRDRAKSQFRRMAATLAWGTFAWFETEPDELVFLRRGSGDGATTAHLVDLLRGS